MSRLRKSRRPKSKGLHLGHLIFIAGVVVAALQAIVSARRQPSIVNDLSAGVAVARAIRVV